MRWCLVAYLFMSLSCFAIEVTPMVLTLDPTMSSQPAYSRVRNTLNRDLAFEIEVYEVDFSKKQPQFHYLDEPPIWVFPPTIYLTKNEQQRIQFRWNGNTPKTDKTYQVTLVEQVVSGQTSEVSQLTMLLNVNMIVHVHQQAFEANLVVENINCLEKQCSFDVRNFGDGASRLSEYEIIISSKDKPQLTFDKQQLKALGYDVFFAPSAISHVSIPILKEGHVDLTSPTVILKK
ncbi:hypothetical protein [Pseudoalteromonas sp. L1]|uniref:hypothetical protein n=1 Tax=unclassified Pseudoalteromonas TaxID=194690 RepID=UPI001F43B9FF|nr:hypothetical protein [Pseudoalteromonas sp. L1]